MASSLRCSQIISGRLIAIQRQPSQLTNCSRILSVVSVYNRNKQRNVHNRNHKFNVHKSIDSSNIFQLIAIGCASILVYNYERWVLLQCILISLMETIYWFLQNSIYEQLIPTVNADAGTEPKNTNSTVDGDTSDDEGVTDDQQAKKKSKKEKIGFRDRKVRLCKNFIDQIVALCSLLSKWFRLFYTREFFFNVIFMFSMSTTLNNRFR